MATRSKTKVLVPERKFAPGDPAGYSSIRDEIVGLLQSARQTTVRSVNALMTATYWEIGRRILEAEQKGRRRAGYGDVLVRRLAGDLTAQFRRGFGVVNLSQMRKFYTLWPMPPIFQTPSEKSAMPGNGRKLQTLSEKSSAARQNFPTLADIANRFLCAQKDAAVARYALEGLPNKVLAAEYQTVLPDVGRIAKELDDTRRALEARKTKANKTTIEKRKA